MKGIKAGRNYSEKYDIIKEEKEIILLLKPIKDKIHEIILTKGPISLTSSILEIFYDKKRKILTEKEIKEGINNKLKKNIITILEKPEKGESSANSFISYLNSRNYSEKIIKIIKNSEYFEELIVQEKRCIQINTQLIKKNITILIRELLEQYNILTCNPEIYIELEEDIQNQNIINFGINKIINNKEINFNNIHNNQIIINTKNNIEENLCNKSDNNYELEKNIKNKAQKIKFQKSERNFIINTNLENENKNKVLLGHSNEIINCKKLKNKIFFRKKFLKRKKKYQKEDNSIIVPHSIHNNNDEINNDINSNSQNKSISLNTCSTLSVESLSFSCMSRKKENCLLEKIISYISRQNQQFISIFGEKNITEREEKKIRDLKQEISQKNLEIKLHEYIIQSWENLDLNLDKEKNTMNLIEILNEEIKSDYRRLNDEMEILYASHYILKKRNKIKNDLNNAEGVKSDFIYNYNICVELYKKIKNNLKRYLICIGNIEEFIQNVNRIDLNIIEGKESKSNNICIYKEEKECIKNIKECIKVLEESIKKNIYKCLLNTPFENQFKEKNINDNLNIIQKES